MALEDFSIDNKRNNENDYDSESSDTKYKNRKTNKFNNTRQLTRMVSSGLSDNTV